jgi:hypothetical protein
MSEHSLKLHFCMFEKSQEKHNSLDCHKIFQIFFINCKVYVLKVWHKSKKKLHVQSTQTSKVYRLCFFQMSLFFTKCAPFLLKIGEDFNIDDLKGKRTWINDVFKITNLNTFNSNMFLTLKIMDFENVALTKVVHIYVIEGMNV